MTLVAALPLLFDVPNLEGAVRAASGWIGLLVILVYSFLIAFALPLPSEIVLCPAGYVCGSVATLGLGMPDSVTVALVVLISGVGKAAGSIVALYVGHGASHSGPVVRAFERLGFDPVKWSKQRMVELVSEYGYVGMAFALTVPGFPDTLSIYAFSVIEENYAKFAAATFTGSVGRLVVTIVVLEGVLLAL